MPSVELRFHRYSPADRGSNSRPRRPDPAFAHPLAGPVSPDTSNPTMPAQPSPRACAHVVSARKWTYYHSAAHQPDQPAGAQGCGRHSLICDTPDRVRPLLRIAATAVHCLPKLVAASLHVLPSANGLCVSVAVRQPIPTSAGANPWRVTPEYILAIASGSHQPARLRGTPVGVCRRADEIYWCPDQYVSLSMKRLLSGRALRRATPRIRSKLMWPGCICARRGRARAVRWLWSVCTKAGHTGEAWELEQS